ncbi:hypothetical protein CONCODRAFT_11547 [Conidiobolus coronatus NRRL 28638]|uniref:F-box domain-containing protein n=1 Tax=Conidiobolus coronatus (strain ATCC 28846 / CBS 209.66 / NRRL 28638) TaxID=796925 RepID=A0A137NVB9_CONC2|nr:hypothetical protein CONCODRAFT_11547 [Conidiobolus coronatus NRRL 28638]|eukprot:KXN66564.1 hypothetical protein CONCODRAFT_11547 [Conidiobolus coronatus NRRL 28638]
MKEENNNNIEKVIWRYLPNIYQLSQYLPQSDLIQLSLACSQFRDKLNSVIFKKLELMRGGIVIPGKPNKSSKKKQLISLLDMLEEGYLDRYNIVNHCIFGEFFNSRFARNFFNLFNNITQLELYSGNDYNCYIHLSITEDIGSNTALIEALYPLKNLESLTMSSELINSLIYSSRLSLKLPVCLKSLNLIESKVDLNRLKFYPFENINEEYSNLKKVTIINDTMLSSMVTRMKSLTDVTIFNHKYFSKNSLIQFLLLNPQLEKLTAPAYFLERDLVNSILQMKQLKQLNIKYSLYRTSDDIRNMPVNKSIEHLNISCPISSDILVLIFNNLKSIKVLEFSNFSFYSILDIKFSANEGRIPLLHLNSLMFANDAIRLFKNPKIFDRIRLTNMFDLDYYLTNYKGDDLESWDVCNLDPTNSTEFNLIKKT